jgi:general secretion pathway protein F
MRYQLKALGSQGVVQLQVEAEDPIRRGARPRTRACGAQRAQRGWPARPALAPRAAFDLVLFSQELTTLLNAGLPLIDALESLAEKSPQAARARTWRAGAPAV